MGRPDEDHVLATISAHAASMLAVARRHSLCHDDAQDAYQRALELYLRRAGDVRAATAGEWLRTVSRNEAVRLRDRRRRLLGTEAPAWEARADLEAREPAERAVAMERVAQAAEALQRCKPDESRAMLLQAGGASYADIAARTGWSATKVNRLLTEGRRSFLQRFAAIESGEVCDHHDAVLSAIADGEATPEDYLAVRPHLRHCVGCRAALKALYDARPALGSLIPPPAAGTPAPPRPEVPRPAAVPEELGPRLTAVRRAVAAKAGVAAAVVVVVAGGAAVLGGAAPALPDTAPMVARSITPVVASPSPTGRSRAGDARASDRRLLPRPGTARRAARAATGRPRVKRRPAAESRVGAARRPAVTARPAATARSAATPRPAATARPATTPAPAVTAAPARPAPPARSVPAPAAGGASTEFGFEG